MIACVVVGFSGYASDFSVDGVYYTVLSSDDSAVEVAPGPLPSYSGSVYIPEEVIYEGKTYTVKAVGVTAFQNCESLREVVLSDSITAIGDSAFAFCSQLSDLVLPPEGGLTSIGSYAFRGCSGLTDLDLHFPIQSIDASAFAGCSAITTVESLNPTAPILNETAFDTGVYAVANLFVPEG